MDSASVFGFVGLVFVLVFGSIYSPEGLVWINLVYMWNAPSAILVIIGTLVGGFACNPMDLNLTTGKLIAKVFKAKKVPLIETLVIIVDVAKVARKNVLAIEDSLPSIENEFLRNGLRLVVDRVDRELITEIMSSEMKYAAQRKEAEAGLFKTMSSMAPGYGMLGTLIGLILMLQNLDDPSKIGPNMAVALITTLYGSMLSNGLFVPWYSTLATAAADEKVLDEMIRDGVLFIEKNERAEFIEQDLMNYLTPSLKAKYEELKFSADKSGG